MDRARAREVKTLVRRAWRRYSLRQLLRQVQNIHRKMPLIHSPRANINATNSRGETLLWTAVRQNSLLTVVHLIASGKRLDLFSLHTARNSLPYTPLALALTKRYLAIAALLMLYYVHPLLARRVALEELGALFVYIERL